MDRLEQRFASQARFWTVAGAIIAAWGLQLDTFQLWDQLSKDSKAVSGLVAMNGVLTEQAQETLSINSSTSWKFHLQVLEELTEESQKTFVEKLEKLPPQDFANSGDIKPYLKKELAGDADAQEFIDAYDQVRQNLAKGVVQSLTETNDEIIEQFSKAGVSLIPKDYPHWTEFLGLWWSPRHFFGMVFTAALLSLGAPFWFNTLKSLASLRPVLANRIEENRTTGARARG